MASGVIEQVVRLKDEASKVLDTVATNAEEAGSEIEDMAGEAKDAGKDLDTMGKGADRASFSAAQLAAGVATAGVALLSMVQGLANSKNELTEWSRRTGVATETLAGLRLAGRGVGVEFNELAEPLMALARLAAQAGSGNEDLAGKFGVLGVAVTDADGSLRSTDAILKDVMRSLSAIKDPAEQAAAATAVLGEQGGRFLAALGDTGNLDRFIAQAELFGANVGPQAAAAAEQWQRSMATLQEVVTGTGDALARSFGADGAGQMLDFLSVQIIYLGKLLPAVGRSFRDAFLPLLEVLPKMAQGDFMGALDALTGSTARNLWDEIPKALDEAGKEAESLLISIDEIGRSGQRAGAAWGAGSGGGVAGAMQAAAEAAEKMGKPADMGALGRSIDFLGRVQTGQRGMGSADFGMASDELARAFSTAFQNAASDGEVRSRMSVLFASALGQAGKAASVLGGAVLNPLGALGATGPQGAAVAASLQALEQIGREGPEKIVQRLEAQTMAIGQGIAQMPELFFMLIDRLPNAIGQAVGEAIRGLFDVKDKLGGGNTAETLLNVATGGLYGMNKGILQGLGIVGGGRDSNASSARTMGAMMRRAEQPAFNAPGRSITINGFVSTDVMDSLARQSEADFSPWGVGRGRRSALGG